MSALVVVESPHKAKTISKILGSGYTVRATVGHIVDLKKGGGTLGVNIEKGFAPQYQVIPDKKDKIKAILDAARSSSKIYIAADPDREGEAIAFAVADQLKKLNKPIQRAEFLEITPAAVKRGLENPRELDENLYSAQQARRVLDRLVGFLVSPYLMKKYGETLSAGRVQSVALRLVVEREEEIKSFVPENYYLIKVNLIKDKCKFIAKYPESIKDKEKAEKIYNEIKKINKFTVVDVKSSEKERVPLPPLTTSTLQQLASSKYRMSADKTMAAAQSLYEAGYITYIRTDSTRNSPESIKSARDYIKSKNFDVPSKPNVFKNKEAAQDAHEALRPTDVNSFPALYGDEEKIYSLIWTRFVASQMTPAIYDMLNVKIKAGEHELVAEGKALKSPGWLAIAGSVVKNEKDVNLPTLAINDNLITVKPGVVNEHKQTKPPARFNDGTLVKELENKEIGRPSTYASIIKRISHRNYINKTKDGFVPTELGKIVVTDLKQFFSFMDYKYTAKMEKELDKIAVGELAYIDMLKGFFNPFKKEFYQAKASQGKETDISCPSCGDKTIVLHGKFGYYAACIKRPACKGTVSVDVENGQIKEKKKFKLLNDILCPECNASMVKIDGKFGPYYGCSRFLEFKCTGKRKIPFGKECSSCGNELYLTVFNGVLKLACMGYPECRNIEDIPKGTKVDWVLPEKINPPKLDKKVEKAVRAKVL